MSDSRNMYTTLKLRIKHYNIDVSHFHQAHRTTRCAKRDIEDILSNKIHYSSSTMLKKRLLNDGYLEYKCYGDNCGLSMWKDKPLVLQLEHMDGNKFNNSLTNLILLCPNCHSQTSTYAGRNKKQDKSIKNKLSKIKEHNCAKCNKIVIRAKTHDNIYCSIECSRTRKLEISKEELEILVWEMSSVEIGKKLGVTDSAIGKKCKSLGIKKPPRGYWAKKKAGK
jgi:hypothetical protein